MNMQDTATEAEARQKPTFGQRCVGYAFNPSGNEKVQLIKQGYAAQIDLIAGADTEKLDDLDVMMQWAVLGAMDAQMEAVKVATRDL